MFKLLHKDCFEVLERIVPESIDCICVDLPYGTTMLEWDKTLPMDRLWEHYTRVLKKSGCVILFGSQPFSSAVVMSNLPWFKYSLVWDKNKCGSPGLAKVRPMKVHEDILIFAPGKTKYNPIMVEGEPYKRRSSNPEGYVGRVNNHKYGMKPRTEFENEGTRYPTSIVSISRDFSAQQQVHPTQKPVAVLEWLLRTYTDEKDVVLDHCMGSGPCGVAAVRLNRHFIGVENNEEYFNIAHERITSESKNQASV